MLGFWEREKKLKIGMVTVEKEEEKSQAPVDIIFASRASLGTQSLISNLVFSLVCTCVFLFFFNSVSLVSIDVVKTGPATKPK